LQLKSDHLVLKQICSTQEAWKDFEWFLDKDKRLAKRIRELLS